MELSCKHCRRYNDNVLIMLLLFSKRKRLLLDESNEVLCSKVKQVEEFLNEPMNIWSDEEEYESLQKVNNLSLEEKRLYIVFALLDCSIPKVAKLFKVDVKTIKSRIDEILNKIKKDD